MWLVYCTLLLITFTILHLEWKVAMINKVIFRTLGLVYKESASATWLIRALIVIENMSLRLFWIFNLQLTNSKILLGNDSACLRLLIKFYYICLHSCKE